MTYAGAHKYLTYASWLLSALSAFVALVPFWYIWRTLQEVLRVAPDFARMMLMTGPGMRAKMTEYQNALADMSSQAVEYVRGIPSVKTFGQTVFSLKKFKGAIDNYKTWVIAYTKQLRLPMMFYTAAINSAFAFLVAAAFLFTAKGVTNQFLLNLLFYIIITPVISTTPTKIMFQSENTMIMEDAPIILLDEAAASLDAENETLIQQTPSQLIQNKTILIIAHRMRTVAGADKIVVLAHGCVAEEGSPEALLQQDRRYANMVKLQSESQNWTPTADA